MVMTADRHFPLWHAVVILALVMTVLTVSAIADAQEMSVPLDVQVQLMARIFSFDRAMDTRTKEGLTIGILYQERFRTSVNTADEVEDLLPTAAWPADRSVRVVRIAWENRADAERAMREQHIGILYVTPLRSVDLQEVGDLCGTQRLPAFTGVSSYVNDGIPLGVAQRGGKAAILVNLPAARRAGTDLSSQVLHIAEVIGE